MNVCNLLQNIINVSYVVLPLYHAGQYCQLWYSSARSGDGPSLVVMPALTKSMWGQLKSASVQFGFQITRVLMSHDF